MGLKRSKMAYAGLRLMACAVITLSVFANPAMAQSCDDGGVLENVKRSFSADAGALMSAAIDLDDKREFESQLAALQQILFDPDLTPYESGVIYQVLGAAHYELSDYSAAVDAFDKALKSGGLTGAECSQLELNIAQLLIANGQNREGALRLERYIKTQETVKPQFVEMLVGTWVQAEDYRRALPWAERWLNEASTKERKHFDLLHFLYGELGMGHKQIEIREQKDALFPSSPSR